MIALFAAQNRILARAMDLARQHKRTLLALMTSAALLLLAAPGRVVEHSQYTDTTAGWMP